MEPDIATAPGVAPRARPIPADGAKALVLINEKAGSVAAGDREKLIEALQGAGVGHYALAGGGSATSRARSS